MTNTHLWSCISCFISRALIAKHAIIPASGEQVPPSISWTLTRTIEQKSAQTHSSFFYVSDGLPMHLESEDVIDLKRVQHYCPASKKARQQHTNNNCQTIQASSIWRPNTKWNRHHQRNRCLIDKFFLNELMNSVLENEINARRDCSGSHISERFGYGKMLLAVLLRRKSQDSIASVANGQNDDHHHNHSIDNQRQDGVTSESDDLKSRQDSFCLTRIIFGLVVMVLLLVSCTTISPLYSSDDRLMLLE